ncbi:Scopoletin glucosyltransferase [Linum grandiflorum]
MDTVHPTRNLHIFFLPFMTYGHMIPMIDIAKLFAAQGVKCTVVTTPLNADFVSNQINTDVIDVGLIRFPAEEVGLPEESESADFISSGAAEKLGPDFVVRFFRALELLHGPMGELMGLTRPDCLVADLNFSWAVDAADGFGIPTVFFHGTGYFPFCALECIRIHKPYRNVSSDSDRFVVPGLPGGIEFTRSQLPESTVKEDVFTKLAEPVIEAEAKSYGVIFNSFLELEPDYVEFYSKEMGRRNWHVGPVSLCNRRLQKKAERGGRGGGGSSTDDLESWLDSKEPNSVIYICFGSMSNFAGSQLEKIARAMESWGGSFVWVVREKRRRSNTGDDMRIKDGEEWLPEGFKEKIGSKGLIIRGWAPQVMILDHVAVGGFMTHCGWNSTLEAITAGKPMVTWPVEAEQFYTEKLVTDVLGVGVGVGAMKWARGTGDEGVTVEGIETAVRKVMDSDEGEAMRRKAKELATMAKRAVEDGGSSNSSLLRLIDELRQHRQVK